MLRLRGKILVGWDKVDFSHNTPNVCSHNTPNVMLANPSLKKLDITS